MAKSEQFPSFSPAPGHSVQSAAPGTSRLRSQTCCVAFTSLSLRVLTCNPEVTVVSASPSQGLTEAMRVGEVGPAQSEPVPSRDPQKTLKLRLL